jgi:hypothetical protein
MCLRRAPEKYIAGAALDRADIHYTNREGNACETGAHETLFNKTDWYAWRLARLFRGFACIHTVSPMQDENRYQQKPSIHLRHKSYKIVSCDARFRRIAELIYFTHPIVYGLFGV